MESKLKRIAHEGRIPFPCNTGERIYMLPFNSVNGLPTQHRRWQRTVDAMLQGVDHTGEMYLMVDQAAVKAGETHRRGGPHIDGNWIPTSNRHGGGGTGRHGVCSGRWTDDTDDDSGWKTSNLAPEALILASDVTASCAYIGEINGDAKNGGDCSHLNLSSLKRVTLTGGAAYIGNVTMIHESLPARHNCFRTIVRLNIPGYTLDKLHTPYVTGQRISKASC